MLLTQILAVVSAIGEEAGAEGLGADGADCVGFAVGSRGCVGFSKGNLGNQLDHDKLWKWVFKNLGW